jgi:hypothetical protein
MIAGVDGLIRGKSKIEYEYEYEYVYVYEQEFVNRRNLDAVMIGIVSCSIFDNL